MSRILEEFQDMTGYSCLSSANTCVEMRFQPVLLTIVLLALIACNRPVVVPALKVHESLGTKSQDPATILKDLVPEWPQIEIIPEKERKGEGWNCGEPFVYGDFNKDGRQKIAISGVLPWEVRKALPEEQEYAGYVLIAAKEFDGAWRRLQFEQISGVMPALVWDANRAVLSVIICQSDMSPINYQWDAARGKFVGKPAWEPQGEGEEP